jgi:hypothetical protein
LRKLFVASALMFTAAFAVAGVHDKQNAKQNTPHRDSAGMSAAQNCPMKLKGTEVKVLDSPTGIAVKLTTAPENIEELQRRVESLAAMYEGGSMGLIIPADVKVESVENGMRLTLTAEDQAKLGEFRLRTRAHVERMKSGNCAMMQRPYGMARLQQNRQDPHH